MSRLLSVVAICAAILSGVVGWGCGGVKDPGPICTDDSACVTPGPCEVAEGASCDEQGRCHYSAKTCDTPPAPTCVSGDAIYRVYASSGTCAPDGSCAYRSYDYACPSCSANCAGVCDGLTCDDDQHGCQSSGRCALGSPAACFYDKAPADQLCDDGNACTYSDHCDGSGHCASTAVSCVSSTSTCGKKRKCNGTATCTEWYPDSTTTCDDGNACTYGDHCDGAGSCLGKSITCTSDAGPCGIVRTCNGTSTCATTYPGGGTSCNDKNACTYGDHCNGAGGCVGTAITCSNDSGTCGARRSCNGTSTCTTSYPGSETPCNDGNLCSYGDHCNGAGRCAGTSYSCSGSSCGTYHCDGTGNCVCS